ncbi:MAG: hypothetical protein KGH72_04930 [Candidatus Micrarchaeota archaeon]|nr:hypothetical protein [Candidatus Micrarchaeota archaeon]
MPAKKTSKRGKGGSRSSRFESFNRSQNIYKILEKGIIESEALSSSAADRPEDDAHVLELLEGSETSEREASSPKARSKSAKRRPIRRKR